MFSTEGTAQSKEEFYLPETQEHTRYGVRSARINLLFYIYARTKNVTNYFVHELASKSLLIVHEMSPDARG